jgi:general secretion pathway protein A
MYEAYWKIREKPFENMPDPRFIYYSQKHEEALSRMLYAVRERKGAAILTGEYGSGKTLLSRILLEELSSEQYQPAIIVNPILPPLELLKEIIYQLGGNTTSLSSKGDLLHYFDGMLYRNRTENKNTVIVIDEAQAVSVESFEELRLLLNFQLNDDFLLTLILLGQPELKAKMDKLPQLKQRFSIRYHLKALAEEQSKEYILHRLEVAGAEKEIFRDDALSEIYRFSEGIPRRINNICDLALLVGCAEGLDKVDKEIIKDVAEDLEEIPIGIKEEVKSITNG